MKVVVEERAEEGLESYMGRPVVLWCLNYIYTGTLVGYNAVCVKLKDAEIVYETGSFSERGFKDSQKLPGDYHYVMLSAVESFGDTK
jgi:hypothetical protein